MIETFISPQDWKNKLQRTCTQIEFTFTDTDITILSFVFFVLVSLRLL
jgi:hypothetical protein